jgi:hypothetical protein
MKTGKCSLCLTTKALKRSHAIPDSIFKKIFKANDGKAIRFNDDDTSHITYSSDSWWEYQLCTECEQHLNNSYEQYSLSAIRGGKGNVLTHERGVTFKKIDISKLQLFFISIFWRAANSKNEAYQNICISEQLNNEIRLHLLNKKCVPLVLITVKISRLIDKTPKNGFDLTALKSMIISPFSRCLPNQKFSFCFTFEGFFIELFTPGLGYKNRPTTGLINPSKEVIIAPFIDIFDIPEVLQLLITGYGKYEENKIKFR